MISSFTLPMACPLNLNENPPEVFERPELGQE